MYPLAEAWECFVHKDGGCKYFETERIIITKAFSVLEGSFQVLLCLGDTAAIECDCLPKSDV